MTMYPYNAHNITMVIPVSKFADLHVKIKSMEEENARLKAEVERLTTENESLQTKSTNIYNAMVVRCKVEEITHKAKADSIISQSMMSEAMKMIEESVAIREQVERLTKAGDAMSDQLLCDYGDNHLTYAWNAAKQGKPRA